MKAKLKFDTATIKNFFSEHLEKIIVGACVIVLCLFIKSIFTRETLPQNLQPQQISKKTQDALKQLGDSQVPKNLHDFDVLPVSDTIVAVPGDDLKQVKAFVRDGNIFDDPNKRADPTLFSPIALQAIGMSGALVTPGNGGAGLAMNPVLAPSRQPVLDPARPAPAPAVPVRPRGGRQAVPPAPVAGPPARQVIGGPAPVADAVQTPVPADMPLPGAQGTGSAEYRNWVIVTGAIPWEMQQKEFELRFSHAQHADNESSNGGRPGSRNVAVQSDRDVPHYIYWRLERKDLTTGGDPVVIDYGDATQIARDREDESIGKSIALLKPKTFKRIDKEIETWGALGGEVVPAEYLDSPWISWPLPGILLHDWGREATNPKIPLTSQPVLDPGATPAAGDDKPAERDPFAPDSSNPSKATAPPPRQAGPQAVPFTGRTGRRPMPMNGPVTRDRSGPGRGNFGPQQLAGRPDNEAPAVPYKLFRFIDFDVEPGHTYEYRIQLVLKNPNFGLAPELLAKPDPKPLPYRDTAWSEASNATTVPLASQIVAEGVDRPKKGEPKPKSGVLMWDKKEVNQLLVKETLELGAVANFIQKKLTAIIDPSMRIVRDYTSDIISDGALLDLHGGGDLATSVDAGGPGELLFLVVGRDGKPDQMTVVAQAADQPALDFWEKTHKVPANLLQPAAAPAGVFGPGGRGRELSAPAPNQPGGLLSTPPSRGAPKETKPPTTKSGK